MPQGNTKKQQKKTCELALTEKKEIKKECNNENGSTESGRLYDILIGMHRKQCGKRPQNESKGQEETHQNTQAGKGKVRSRRGVEKPKSLNKTR